MENVISLLMGVIVGAVGAYFSGYSHKKGENLATKEDIKELAAQTALLTQTAKEIEATISDKMWDRQKRWELKRDQIFLVTASSTKIMKSLVKLRSELKEQDGKKLGRIPERMDAANLALNNLDSVGITATLVCSQKWAGAMFSLIELTQDIIKEMMEGNHQVLSEKLSEFAQKHTALLTACREELGTDE